MTTGAYVEDPSPGFRLRVLRVPVTSVLSTTSTSSHSPARTDSEALQQHLSWGVKP